MAISGIGGGFSGYGMNVGRGSAVGGVKIEAKTDVDSVREKGLVAFARDAKKTAWEEKLKQWREEAMKAMGLTQDRLDAMSPEQRSGALKMVEEAVQQKIKDAMESAKKQGKDGVSVPQFVDMSV
jgi:isopropylmalate/homocitrate/citramalate synthase